MHQQQAGTFEMVKKLNEYWKTQASAENWA